MTESSQTRRRLEQALGVPFCSDTHIRALNNGREIFPAMLHAIEQARYRIDFATFVYWQGDIADRFARALADRARAGVRVRVLLDAFGAKQMRDPLLSEMRSAGAEIRWFRPLLNWRFWRIDKRMHRKILVCDNTVGFTGGVGIASEWEGDARDPGEWRDMHFALSGAVVHGLRAAFLDNWNESGAWETPDLLSDIGPEAVDDTPPYDPAGGPEGDPAAGFHAGPIPAQVLRSSTTIGWNDITTALRLLVAMSRDELRIVTPYFNPDPALVELLTEARQRGVDVRLLTGGPYTDSRLSQFAGGPAMAALTAAGVRAWRYQKTMLHLKMVTVDGSIACVGSANLNQRTLAKDEECCVLLLSAPLIEALNRGMDRDIEHAQSVDPDRLARRGLWTRCGEACARLIGRQL